MNFNDRTVIVTGAAGNLGRAVANTFEALGANLVLVDLRREEFFSGYLRDPAEILARTFSEVDGDRGRPPVHDDARRAQARRRADDEPDARRVPRQPIDATRIPRDRRHDRRRHAREYQFRGFTALET